MCYSKNTSLISFLFGLSTSFVLIELGNSQSNSTNMAIGYFFMFVSIMQFIEYLIWSDPNCVKGWNKLGAILGPIFNHLQPVVLFIFASIYLQSSNVLPNDFVVISNILYLCYVGYKYYQFIDNSSNLCVGTNNQGHIDWTWKKDFDYNFYHLIMLINFTNFYSNTNLFVAIGVSYLVLLFSIYNFKENIGEFWCLIVTGIPLVNLFIQKVLGINN